MNSFSTTLRLALCAGALVIITGLSQVALAQGPPTGGPEPGNPTDPTAVPIDGGASLLLAAGGAYGLSRLRKRKAQ